MFFRRCLAAGEMAVALGLWAVALWGIAVHQEAILQWLFFFAWYPYLLFLDGLLFRLQGESWLTTRPRDFLKMLLWSVTVWLIFEGLNLGLKNWGYLGVTPLWWLRWPCYALAFATVVPGILLTAQVLSASGTWASFRGRPRDPSFWQSISLLLGAASLVLPLIFPTYAFPLIWGAFFFLLDPFCDLLGEQSLIRSWAAGERQEHLCLLTAGLICGIWWELWNYPASSKWVYTLPVLNSWKIFEMPVLGYLGFPPFALECAVMYNFLKALDTGILTSPGSRRSAYLLQGAFWILMFAAMDAWTVISFR
jgi:hypothetical protein